MTSCRHEIAPVPAGIIVASGPHYQYLFGRRYRTKIPLYIFTFASETEYRYVGTRADGFSFGPRELPPRITRDNIGKMFPLHEGPPSDSEGDLIIADVAPAGSVLTIRAETHHVTFMSGVRGSGGYPMGFICKLNYDDKTNYVFSEFIQARRKVSGKVPNEYLDKTVVERIQ
ncbi:MAG: hypothetical protein KGR98_11015 [Verrucomicrobia bacterium]|nr:hypothetical protein [Verrucomicrobiota bacterium]